MKNAIFALGLLLCLFPGLQRPATGQTLAVRPGEQATLTLKLVNVADRGFRPDAANVDSQVDEAQNFDSDPRR